MKIFIVSIILIGIVLFLYTTMGVEVSGHKIGLQTYSISEPQLTPYEVGDVFSMKSNMDMDVVWELDSEPVKEEFGVRTSSFILPELRNNVRDSKGNVVVGKLGTNHILILRYNDGVKTWII